MWTHFWDMSSGGTQKEKWHHIYIEAPRDEAEVIFFNRFGHNPERVTCTCCGGDYSISEKDSLEQITGFHRGCAYVYRDIEGTQCSEKESWEFGSGLRGGFTGGYEECPDEGGLSLKSYQTIEEYAQKDDILIIHANEIKDEERQGDVPEQGYVWKD